MMNTMLSTSRPTMPRRKATNDSKRATLAFLGVVLSIFALAGVAQAARIAISPLETAGIEDTLAETFRQALKDAFDRAPHEIAPATSATYQVRSSVKREKSIYDFDFSVLEIATGKIVAEKRAECVPCTEAEAVQKFRVAVQTLQLKVSGLRAARTSQPASATTARTAPASSTADASGTAEASSAGRGVGSASAPSARPVIPRIAPAPAPVAVLLQPTPGLSQGANPPRHRFTRWYRGLMATAFVPGLVLGATGIVLACNQGQGAGENDCHTTTRVLAAGLGLTAVGHLLVVTDVVNVLGASPENPRGHTALAWSSIAAGLALGAGGYLIVRNHGYGNTAYKVLGYADLPIAAMNLAMGLGTIVAGPTTAEGVEPFVSVGAAGLQGRF
jgi:hypothetical protein